MRSELILTWADIHADALRLTEHLRSRGPFDGLVAVSRGGLVPAAIVAAQLNIRLVETLSLASYGRDRAQAEVEIIKPIASRFREGRLGGLVVVDDLVDTGASGDVIRSLMPHAVFATLYAKPQGRDRVDVCVREFSQDTWLVFPWDMIAAGGN